MTERLWVPGRATERNQCVDNTQVAVTTVLGRRARRCGVTLVAGEGPKALTSVDMELQPTADGTGTRSLCQPQPGGYAFPMLT